jgi:2',3'-cyclic-nucleotide 2'-phosphodiesterase (5'-nucleotidase family)
MPTKRLIIIAFMTLFASASICAEGLFRITILYTNDLHGWMLPFDYTNANSKFLEKESIDSSYERSNMGGLARRSTLIKDLRQNSPDPVILMDTGDIFARGPWHKLYWGDPEISAYNAMSYDMICVGNNDLKGSSGTESQKVMLKLMRESKFPWLCANLTVGDTGVPVEGIHPFIIREYGDVRVGFIGLTAIRSKDYPQTKGWTIEDPIEAARRWVPLAREECDILIAVTHIGFDQDRILASQVDGIDGIVGGDSHTFIAKPFMAKNAKGQELPIAQDGAYGVYLGKIQLTFEKTDGWHLVKNEGDLIAIDSKIAEDRAITHLLEKCYPK